MTDLLRDPNEPVALKPREDGPTYFLRVPRVADRATFRHEVAAAGGRQWLQLELVTTAKQALERLLPGDESPQEKADTMATLDAYAERIMTAITLWREDQTDENMRAINDALVVQPAELEVFEVLSTHDSVLARRLADNRFYSEKAGPVAARQFLVGWEGEGLPEFKRSKLRGLDDNMLEYIPTNDLIAISNRIHELLEPSQAKLGNLESESSGTQNPERLKAPKGGPKKSQPQSTTGSISTGSAAA